MKLPPPLAVKVWLKDVPPAPESVVPEAGAIDSVGGLTVREIVELVKPTGVAVLLSVPVTVKVKTPAAVGLPVMAPLLPNERPAGSAPLASVVANVYGARPPDGVRLWL